MKLTTRGRYGLRAMLDLALNYSADHISLSSIAERQGISEGYLEQLIIPLKKAGLVKGIRGAQGGYTLSKPPSNISVGEVLRVLEGPLAIVDCLTGENRCAKSEDCITRHIWKKISENIAALVDSITLDELIGIYRTNLLSSSDFKCEEKS